jgi:hypothetical protein
MYHASPYSASWTTEVFLYRDGLLLKLQKVATADFSKRARLQKSAGNSAPFFIIFFLKLQKNGQFLLSVVK